MHSFSKAIRNGGVMTALTVMVGLGLVATPRPAQAIYCANCSTFYQQMLQYAKNVEAALNTAQQLSTQIQQYQNMVRQGVQLPNRIFSQITGDLQKVMSIYNDAKSLGRDIASFDEKFKASFKDYDEWLKEGSFTAKASADRYMSWSKQGRDNARTAIHAAGINVSSFAEENTTLDQIVARSQSANGRMQAIQAGNEIAAQNVQQLQKLRDLMATQITLQGNYMAQLQERQAVDDAFKEQFTSGKNNGTGATKEY